MDQILHVSLFDGQARAMIADCTELVEAARATHDLTPTASAALGRTLTASAILGTMMKNASDSLTISIKGGGPIGSIVCVAKETGVVKGYCDNPQVDLPLKSNGKLDVGGAVGTSGRITVVKDLGLRDPYVGQTRMVSGEIAEDLAFYLTVSEQTPSLLALGVLVEHGCVEGAGGVLIQPMPGCSEEVLSQLEGLTQMLSHISTLVRDAGDAYHLMELTLVGMPHEVLQEATPRYACDCSRERIERVLLSLGESELRDMMAQQHGADMACHFCNHSYHFTEGELEELIAQAKDRTPDGQAQEEK